jgi:hypothetical protein
MSHSDDVSGAVVGMSSQVAQKGVETASHLVDKTVDNIAKLLQALFNKSKQNGGQDSVKSSDMTGLNSGEVEIKELIADGKKNGDSVISTDGYSRDDMKFIEAKAQEYGIPVAFTNKEGADNICAHVRGSDRAIFERICTEMMGDKLKSRPQELDNFSVAKWKIDGIQREFSRYDLNANWGETKDGEFFCMFEKADKKAILMARAEFARKCGEVEKDLTISQDGDFYTLKDEKIGAEITFDSLPSRNELSAMFQERFGYDENKAEIACAKFGETQLAGEAKREFFADNPRGEFARIENHIELQDENLLVKDYDCLRVTPKSDGVPCVVFRDENNNFAVLNPEKMTRAQMAETIRESLGLTDADGDTVSALVEKAEGVNDFYQRQNADNFVHHQDGIGRDSLEIERLGKDEFSVNFAKQKDNTLVLSFSDKKNALAELQGMFKSQGLSDGAARQSAREVFAKAQAQSAEKILHIEEIKASRQSSESHGTAATAASSAVVTVRYGSQTEEIDIGERDATLSEIGDKFGVSEKESAALINRAQERIDEHFDGGEKEKVITDDKSDNFQISQNGHEKNVAEPIKLDSPRADIPKAAALPKVAASRKK